MCHIGTSGFKFPIDLRKDFCLKINGLGRLVRDREGKPILCLCNICLNWLNRHTSK